MFRYLTVRFKSIADHNPIGKTMMKICGALAALLAILMTASQGQDYLDGGYAGSGDYGDIGQYFNEPIFYSPGSSYASSGPAISGMQNPIDRTKNIAALGSLAKRAKQTASKTEAIVPDISATNVAGRWHLELSDSTSIDLQLYESGNVVFGRGNLTSATTSQWATSNGVISGNSIRLAVVPSSGTVLYLISLDTVRPSLGGSYTAFRAGGKTKSGPATANRLASTPAP
jgi:hypothetical protein